MGSARFRVDGMRPLLWPASGSIYQKCACLHIPQVFCLANHNGLVKDHIESNSGMGAAGVSRQRSLVSNEGHHRERRRLEGAVSLLGAVVVVSVAWTASK